MNVVIAVHQYFQFSPTLVYCRLGISCPLMFGGAMWLDLANELWVDYLINTSGKIGNLYGKRQEDILYVISQK